MSRRERHRRRSKNRGFPLGKVLGMTAVVIIAALSIGALGAAGWVLNKVHAAPNLPKHPTVHPSSPSEIFASDGSSLGYTRSDGVHIELTYKQIPKQVREATIAIEDRRFYQHGALDYEGIVRAAIKDAVHGSTALQGASTLTHAARRQRVAAQEPERGPRQAQPEYKIVAGQARPAVGVQALQELDPRPSTSTTSRTAPSATRPPTAPPRRRRCSSTSRCGS